MTHEIPSVKQEELPLTDKVGQIVVNADEWTLSNSGFAQAPDAATFVTNIAKWFTGGRSTGKFHAYSTTFGLTESSLAETMTKAGYTWTVGTNIKFDLPTLSTFDGIFVAGDLAADNQVLIDYVKAGGNVYVCAGTGVGGAQQEADRWNTFLNAFGLKFAGAYNGIVGNQTVNSSHPLFAGVKAIHQAYGNSIVDLYPASGTHEIILTHANGEGLIAAFGRTKKPKTDAPTKVGKIVVNSDEWTLSNGGFAKAPDAATFVTNIAKWFTGGRSTGKFHAYSANFGLTESLLAETMTKAGYTWTVGTNIKFDLPTLLTFDGIFVVADLAADNQVLIDYVKAGGNVYVCAGTGRGGAQQEADRWNTFLNAFGLKIAGAYDGIVGNQTVNSSHPLFAGVKAIYQVNGSPIVDLDPASGTNQIILTHPNGQGLIATFEGTQKPNTDAQTPEVKPAPAPILEPQPEPQTPDGSDSEDESDSEEVINEFVEAETTGTATGEVAISDIAYKGKVKRTQSDEYIEITNKGTTPTDLAGWKVMSGLSKKQSFTFAAGTTLAAGKSFRVYTNEVHPETGGFSIGSSTGIWNDKGDEGKLFDAQGNQVSTLAYGLSGIPGIKAELGVPKLIVQASPSGVNKQMALQGKVTFIQAVKLATTNFLEDDNDPESPLALILEQPDAYGLPEGVDKAAATEFLRSHLNQPTVKMLLHTPKMGYAPENGETIADNWIFQLNIDDGVIHWAIVDRSGVKAPYNYGFS